MNETHEERVERLRNLRQKAAERIQSETPEERAERLEVLRQNSAVRIELETAEQQGKRLQTLRVNSAARIESEAPDRRAKRLENARKNDVVRIASETTEERELRLEEMRKRRRVNIENESEKERNERLLLLRKNIGERRAKEASVEEAQASSREEYLYQGGWQDVDNPLYEQEWVKNEMNRFHSSQEMLQHRRCTVCKETWPTKQNLIAENIQCYDKFLHHWLDGGLDADWH